MGICNSPSLFTVKVGRLFSSSTGGLGLTPIFEASLSMERTRMALDSGSFPSKLRLDSRSDWKRSSSLRRRAADDPYLRRSPIVEVGMVPDSALLGLAGKILGVLECTPKGSYTGVAEIIGGSE